MWLRALDNGEEGSSRMARVEYTSCCQTSPRDATRAPRLAPLQRRHLSSLQTAPWGFGIDQSLQIRIHSIVHSQLISRLNHLSSIDQPQTRTLIVTSKIQWRTHQAQEDGGLPSALETRERSRTSLKVCGGPGLVRMDGHSDVIL
jgi:hypothetical protein